MPVDEHFSGVERMGTWRVREEPNGIHPKGKSFLLVGEDNGLEGQ